MSVSCDDFHEWSEAATQLYLGNIFQVLIRKVKIYLIPPGSSVKATARHAFVEMKRNGCSGIDPKDLAARRDCDKQLGNLVIALRDKLDMQPIDVNTLIEFLDIKGAAEEFQRRRTLGHATD